MPGSLETEKVSARQWLAKLETSAIAARIVKLVAEGVNDQAQLTHSQRIFILDAIGAAATENESETYPIKSVLQIATFINSCRQKPDLLG